MNSQSTLGYVLALLGIVAYLFSFNGFASALSLPALPSTIALVALVVLVGAGIFLIAKASRTPEVRDLPIYEGKELVGYRRHKVN